MAQTFNASLDSDEALEDFPEFINPPPEMNLMTAILKIAKICEDNNIRYCVMGGASMIARGMEDRVTEDADILVEARPRDIFRMIDHEPELYIPNTRNLERVIPIRVKTGRRDGCQERYRVRVDLKITGRNGVSGTPDTLVGHRELVTVLPRRQQVPMLIVPNMVVVKFKNCADRALDRDMLDLFWLFERYPDQAVLGYRSELLRDAEIYDAIDTLRAFDDLETDRIIRLVRQEEEEEEEEENY